MMGDEKNGMGNRIGGFKIWMKYSRIPYNHSETGWVWNINKEMEDEYVWIEFRKPEILWRVLFGDEFNG